MEHHHKNTLLRIKRVCEIVNQHYEPGNYAKSYYKVWKEYVYPLYPMCYRTLLKYVSTPLNELVAEGKKKDNEPSLFDDLDND
ncbi:MAG: hypothetical protein IJ686_04730 [Bacteroidales bacterium]|nr:hypothetical protein [Bacteroidales bacterium]